MYHYHILARTINLRKSTTYMGQDTYQDPNGHVMYQDLDHKHFQLVKSLTHSNFCFFNLVVRFNECVLINK